MALTCTDHIFSSPLVHSYCPSTDIILCSGSSTNPSTFNPRQSNTCSWPLRGLPPKNQSTVHFQTGTAPKVGATVSKSHSLSVVNASLRLGEVPKILNGSVVRPLLGFDRAKKLQDSLQRTIWGKGT